MVCSANSHAPKEVEKALPNCPGVKTLVLCGGQREGWHDYDGESVLFTRSFHRETDTACGSDPMVMFFSSGTTGFPKGAMLTHYNVVNHGKNIGDCMDLSTADRMMIQVPMFHCFGMVLAMTAAMAKAEEDNIDFNTPGAWEQVYEQVMEGAH